MSLTVTVKDELALVATENAAQRRAEVSAMLRFAGGLHIVSGRIVVEAELDHGGAVRRLHQHLKELYGMEPEVMVVQGGSLHRGSRYVLRVQGPGPAVRAGRRPGPAGAGHAGVGHSRRAQLRRCRLAWSLPGPRIPDRARPVLLLGGHLSRL